MYTNREFFTPSVISILRGKGWRVSIPKWWIAGWEILPSGFWPVETGSGTGWKGNPTAAQERIAFLIELRPVASFLKKAMERKYCAFVFRGRRTGRLLVIAEAPVTENALYLFEGGPGWESVASRTRYELRTLKPSGYLGRICHHSGWQRRVLGAIEQY